MTATEFPAPATLPDALALAWDTLLIGARDRRGAAHTPMLATVDARGFPSLRTVVLRGCEAEARELLIHTDVRSAKYAELGVQPACALLAYDAPRKLQLRLDAVATRHHDDALADRQWAASRPMSRQVYGSPLATGAVVDDPLRAAESLRDRSEAEQRQNFAVLRLTVTMLDLLHLAAGGHRRARFVWTGAAAPQMSWVVP